MERSTISNYKVWRNKGGDRINSVYYRNHDLPSIISPYSEWYWINKKGKSHREKDLPATICDKGVRIWCKNGQRHREKDLPVFIFYNGNKRWYKEGKLIK